MTNASGVQRYFATTIGHDGAEWPVAEIYGVISQQLGMLPAESRQHAKVCVFDGRLVLECPVSDDALRPSPDWDDFRRTI